MKKPYCGNQKPYILALFHDSDRQKVMPILEKLEKTGLEQYGFDGKIRKFKAAKACAFVVFLSGKLAEEPERLNLLSFAKQRNIPVIPLRLDEEWACPKGMEELLDGQDIIGAENMTPDEMTARILQADVLDPPAVTEQQKKCAKIRMLVLSGTIIALIIAGVVSIGIKTQGWFSPKAKQLMLRSWMRGDLTLLEQLLH